MEKLRAHQNPVRYPCPEGCGEDVSGGSLTRRLKARGDLFKYHELAGNDNPDDIPENLPTVAPTPSGPETHIFSGMDDDTTDFRQAREQAERRHDVLVKEGERRKRQEPNERKLGRYDGWLNDPTPSPTRAPTPYPTFAPTTAPDPVTFTTIVYENAGASQSF